MGMAGGGGGKSTTEETKEYKLPAWVEAAGMENYGLAKNIASRPYQAYGGQTVAKLSPEFTQARGRLPGLDDYYGNYQQGSDALRGLLDFAARDVTGRSVTAGQLKDTDLNPYLNPYIANVEKRTTDNMLRTGELQQDQLATQAAAAKSFGGSRQAIQQAVQGAETNRSIGDMSAKLRQEGYDKAREAALADIGNKLKAETQTGQWGMDAQRWNQAADIEGAQIRRGSATDLANVADQAQAARMNEIAQFLGIGQISQEQQQRVLDDKYRRWLEKKNYPLEGLNIRLATLGMTPYGHTETGTSTTRSQTGGGGGGFLNFLGPAMKLLGGFGGLSDETEKVDIQRVGRRSDKIPLYAYRYRGDPKTYPKVVGPMAQDVEKKYPHAVRKIGGKRVVDMSYLGVD